MKRKNLIKQQIVNYTVDFKINLPAFEVQML
jgi:hypothetical protein